MDSIIRFIGMALVFYGAIRLFALDHPVLGAGVFIGMLIAAVGFAMDDR